MEERYERDAERFLEGMDREFYLTGAGLKEELEIAPLFDRYGWLFSRDAVTQMLARRQDRGSRYLAEFGVEYYMENTVKSLTEQVENAKMKATVAWDGKEVPYRSAPVLVANEPDPGRRHELQRRLMQRTAQFNPTLAERMNALHQGARDLGFADYVGLWDELAELRLARLADDMRQVLARTHDIYFAQLAAYLEQVGVTPAEADTSDTSRIIRAPQLDALFPEDRLVAMLRQTYLGLGVDMDKQANLHLDIESRPLKSPRAFCATIRVPEEVMLVIRPHGGRDDYHSILHESGHAEHYANVDPDLPMPFRRLGDNSVTEGYAELMDDLLRSRRWLADVLGLSGGEDHLRLANFYKVYIVRRYASKLLYELELHRGDVTNMGQLYADTLGANLGVRVPPENYLSDVDDSFYAARYLRSWIFAVLLRQSLVRRYGHAWFASPAAGEFLVGLWREGQRRNADEIARDLGYNGLDIGPLIEDLLSQV